MWSGRWVPKCHYCRFPHLVTPTEEDFRWWRERFTQEQIDEMAAALNMWR